MKNKIIKLIFILAYIKRVFKNLIYINSFFSIRILFKGFIPNKKFLYDFKRYPINSFTSDYDRFVRHPLINYEFKSLFNDKLIFNFFIKNFTHNISEVIGFVFDNKYFSLNSEFDISRAEYNLIGRLRNGWNAIGIKRFLSGTYNKTEIEKFNNYVFTLELKNDSYCSKIFSSSLNTIRIISAWNNDNFIKIIAAVHRFGIKDDIVADNFQSGGGTALVDIKSGVLGELIYFKGKKRIITHKHPLTNMQILGVKIPKWKNICENLIKIHMQMPYLKYIAWDIAIISGGDWVIIEGNHVSGLEAIQIHEPFKLPF